MKPGSRIRISLASRSLMAPWGALGYVEHEVPELAHVYDERCWSVRLDDHGHHIQWQSELELVEEESQS